jgi:hypothetical protein
MQAANYKSGGSCLGGPLIWRKWHRITALSLSLLLYFVFVLLPKRWRRAAFGRRPRGIRQRSRASNVHGQMCAARFVYNRCVHTLSLVLESVLASAHRYARVIEALVVVVRPMLDFVH